MNKKYIFGIFVLGVVLTTAFVSAGFFGELFNGKASITGNAVSNGWTKWIDVDNPSGSGDYEHLTNRIVKANACENPTAMECRTKRGKIDSDQTGQIVTCDVAKKGFSCLNRLQENRERCLDYEVRFYCGDPTECVPDCSGKSCGSDGCGGSCGSCSLENSRSGCVSGQCEVLQCNSGYENCDLKEFNGCEVNVNTDQRNCGDCGVACNSGEICSGGSCVFGSSTCGNGRVESGEQCDDGNTVSGDGCSSTCSVESGYVCSRSPSVCIIGATCGNGVQDVGEQCDGSAMAASVSCEKLGYSFGTLGCTNSCLFDTSGCSRSSKEVTYQGVLDMMRIGSYGSCDSVETPWREQWDPLDDDYAEDVAPFVRADANSDEVTTGAEYCSYKGLTCLFGFRSVSRENSAVKDVIGCYGGFSHEVFQKGEAARTQYLCCSAP